MRGLNAGRMAGMSEDDRRAAGIDVSRHAGPHDDSPEATKLQGAGGSTLDAYASSADHRHDNVAGERQELVVGQAPVARAYPMRGSRAHGQPFDPDLPNPINRSPVQVGGDTEHRSFEDLRKREGDEKPVEETDEEQAAA